MPLLAGLIAMADARVLALNVLERST